MGEELFENITRGKKQITTRLQHARDTLFLLVMTLSRSETGLETYQDSLTHECNINAS